MQAFLATFPFHIPHQHCDRDWETVLLKVGASTEAEAKYLKDKIDDAVNATKAAVEEGIVAGGGMALMRISEQLYPSENIGKDQFNDFMKKVMLSPLDKIMFNSGESDVSIGTKLLLNPLSGYDALNGVVVDNIIEKGIIDPVKVTRCALKHASSLASMLPTTDRDWET